MTLTVAEVLDKAADHIEQVGWFQGSFADYAQVERPDPWAEIADPPGSDTCRVCAEGAIRFAAGGYPWAEETDEGRAARELLEAVLGTEWLFEWNDTPGRTQAEVVAVLRAAAVKARES